MNERGDACRVRHAVQRASPTEIFPYCHVARGRALRWSLGGIDDRAGERVGALFGQAEIREDLGDHDSSVPVLSLSKGPR